jgi:hypothetical protein
MRNGLHSPEQIMVTDLFKTNMMILDVLLEEDDRSIVCGSVNVMDSSKITLAHLAQFNPSLVKKMTTLFQVKITEPTKAVVILS